MSAVQKKTYAAVRTVHRQLLQLESKPTPKVVHRIRTSGRRLEVVLTELAGKPSRSSKKLVKLLARLRKKAGRLRDLDIQIALLRGLKMPEGARHKLQLMQMLTEERAKGERKMAQYMTRNRVRDLRKRLKRTASELNLNADPWDRARGLLRELSNLPAQSSEETLRQYRIDGKRARYLVELAAKTPETDAVIEQLKNLQQVLGDWHDWLKLSQRAEAMFRSTAGSPLVAALQNLARAKFRQAIPVVEETRVQVAQVLGSRSAAVRKAASSTAVSQAAAA
jgi:CHAD domain-containing protein